MNKSKTFLMTAVLKKVVLDDVCLRVRASSEDHAYEIAKHYLEDHPSQTKVHGHDVPFFAVENRETLDSEIVDLNYDDETEKA